MSFTGCMKPYFGLLPGQTIGQFAADLKLIPYEDKLEFAEMLNGAGFQCDPPTPPVTPTS